MVRTMRGFTKHQKIERTKAELRINPIAYMRPNKTRTNTKFDSTHFRYFEQMYAPGKPPLSK